MRVYSNTTLRIPADIVDGAEHRGVAVGVERRGRLSAVVIPPSIAAYLDHLVSKGRAKAPVAQLVRAAKAAGFGRAETAHDS